MKQIIKCITCLVVLFFSTKGFAQHGALNTLISSSAYIVKAIPIQAESSSVRITESTNALYYKVVITSTYKGNGVTTGDTVFVILNQKICENSNDSEKDIKPKLNTSCFFFLNSTNNRYQGLKVFNLGDLWFGWYPENGCMEEQIKKTCLTKNKSKK